MSVNPKTMFISMLSTVVNMLNGVLLIEYSALEEDLVRPKLIITQR